MGHEELPPELEVVQHMLALPMALYMTTEQVECVVPGLEGTQEVYNLYVFAKPEPQTSHLSNSHLNVHLYLRIVPIQPKVHTSNEKCFDKR